MGKNANKNQAKATGANNANPADKKDTTAQKAKGAEPVKSTKKSGTVFIEYKGQGSYNGVRPGEVIEIERAELDTYLAEKFEVVTDGAKIAVAEEQQKGAIDDIREKLTALGYEWTEEQTEAELLEIYQAKADVKNTGDLNEEEKKDLME